METRIYRVGYAVIVFTVRSSKIVSNAFATSSLNLHCAPLHVAATPPSDVLLLLGNIRHAKLLFPNHIATNYNQIYSYNKSQQNALFVKFILVQISTCLGQIYCPSSGVTNTSCCVYSIKTPNSAQHNRTQRSTAQSHNTV